MRRLLLRLPLLPALVSCADGPREALGHDVSDGGSAASAKALDPCTRATDGDHTFRFCTTRVSWADAQAACAAAGQHLADVESASEGAWIWGVADGLDGASGWWHGANDRAIEGSWAWDGGATSTYTNWRPGEPNDYAGAEDCGAFAEDGAAAWNDKDCATLLPYVCEEGCLWAGWYTDADADGFGDPATLVRACDAPVGAVSDAGDCDDTDPDVAPDAPEVCGGGDEDCDGLVDDADGSVDPASFGDGWVDADGDGYGDPGAPVRACADTTGVSSVGTDCDDSDPNVFPGAVERENGRDDDCDGSAELDDADQDGLERTVEIRLGTDPEDPDTDADGVGDGVEVPDVTAPPDTDADGALDPLDADDDGDRLTTRAEIGAYDPADPESAPDDVDGDGAPDHLDLDTDNDGVPDGVDAFVDTDRDGIANVEDPDDDGDFLPTVIEDAVDQPGTPPGDADGDGVDNYLDPDSDNDGCVDGPETDGVSDPDGDGRPAFVDPDECAPSPADTGGADTAWTLPDGGGCGCGGTHAPGLGALLLAAVASVRRHRRSATCLARRGGASARVRGGP